MSRTLLKAIGAAGGIAALALGGAAPALAKTHHHKRHHAQRHTVNASTSSSASTGSSTSQTGETALTGATLTSAENAATAANAGSTAVDATTETDSSLTGAAYEVHITQADGSRAVVIEDSSFNVLATQAAGGCGGGHGGPGGAGNGETALSGATLTSAESAATAANAGSTAVDATTETDSSLTGAAYEVHITQADGSRAVVIEDSGFNVLATQAAPAGGPGSRH